MRMKNVEIDPKKNNFVIDVMKHSSSFAIVVSEGKARITELPPHGETKIVTHQGKVKRVKWDEGEEF